jgi:ABC-2 type transport system permease protein
VTRNLDAVLTRFVSSMDTVKAAGIKKTPLLLTSSYSRAISAPVNISINQLRHLKPQDLSTPKLSVAYLLEGKFTSLYKNRFLPDGISGTGFRPEGESTKIIIVSDGDVARNEVNSRSGQPQALGFDSFTNYTFANRDFLMNAVAYLLEENGLIQTRNREVRIRPLDRARIKSEKVKWQTVNLALPLLGLIVYGTLRMAIRRRKYARF